MSLVQNILQKASSSDYQISDLLRLVKVSLHKLGAAHEFMEWVDRELDGYPDQASIPQYRKLTGGKLGIEVMQGYWQEAHISDPEISRIVKTLPLLDSAPQVEKIIKTSKETMISYRPSDGQQMLLRQLFKIEEGNFQVELAVYQLNEVLNNIRNRILDWAIELDKSGISGENFEFTENEVKTAKEHNVHIHMNMEKDNSANININSSLTHSQNQGSPKLGLISWVVSCVAGIGKALIGWAFPHHT